MMSPQSLPQSRTALVVCGLVIAWMFSSPLASAQGQAPAPAKPAVQNLDWSQSMTGLNQLERTINDGTLTLTTTGPDPYFWFTLPELPEAERDWILSIEYFCPSGIKDIQWRTGRPALPLRFTELPAIDPAEGWTTYRVNLRQAMADAAPTEVPTPVRLDLGRAADVQLQIRRVTVRPMNDAEWNRQQHAERMRQRKVELADEIASYLDRQWPAKIDSVRFENPSLRVLGRVQADNDLSRLQLVARLPHEISALSPTDARQLTWPLADRFDRDRFELAIHIEDPADSLLLRPGVRWQVVRNLSDGTDPVELCSAATYRDPVEPHRAALPPTKKLRHAKGLTCVRSAWSSKHYQDLGIEHGSVNIVLTGLVSSSPRPGWTEQLIHGNRWWINTRRLKQLDQNVRCATDAGMVVAGILLIPISANDASSIRHPEADEAGIYAMPDLTSDESTTAYSATLEVLAQRYSGRFPEHGRIDHWIVHNEVDYGWQWTNMGEQPLDVFMDHYVRSMRLIDHAARSWNRHARVFISLTHRWNVDDSRPWKTYAPRDMLQWLLRHTQQEGDFPWGVAYHPYPQSLWEAATWNDSRVDDSFDTPLITIKNLPVLDRFLRQPQWRLANGDVRPILCSEQGFHADPGDPEQLRVQSAALLYTWTKLRQCPSILAFDYHRPSDHPNEGGLKLGLRGEPKPSAPLGDPKPAWDVYRAIGTPREAKLRQQFESLWNASDR
jgi:hypothetical protein